MDTCFLGAPPSLTNRTAKHCQFLETQPLQTAPLIGAGQCTFNGVYAFFCFKGPKSFLVEGKEATKDIEVPAWSLAARGFLGGFAGYACV